MLTLFGTYILAIAVGAGCAVINDLFFITSLKHHKLKSSEFNILSQLNKIQLVLILWIVLVEAVFFATRIQTLTFGSILGVSIAKFAIELVILFSVLFQKQLYLPALFRHQHKYGHLSDSFLEHSNGLLISCITSITSWFFIVFITSSEFKQNFVDFGFGTTISVYLVTTICTNLFFLFMKNRVLHRKNR